MDTTAKIIEELEKYIDPVKREYLPNFFKTGKGQYGEGDKFLGIVVPNTRLVAKKFKDLPLNAVEELLMSDYHEHRLCSLLILVERFKKADENTRKLIYDFYISHTDRINNWDLVDLSCYQIVGTYLEDKSREELYRRAESTLLWDQRIAIVSTFQFIKNNDFTDIYSLAEKLLLHKHDLMQKAIGWMLREAGKRDKKQLISFLDKFYHQMPRTMLRYSIEKFSDEERKYYMKK